MDSSTLNKDKTLRLFTYLKNLSMLKTTLVRDVNQYENILWFSDIPQEKECKTPLQAGSYKEVWLEIKKPLKPPFPLPPEKLKLWLNSSIKLENETIDPNLVKQIPNPNFKEPIEIEEINEPSFLYLTDNPEITKMYADYLDKKVVAMERRSFAF